MLSGASNHIRSGRGMWKMKNVIVLMFSVASLAAALWMSIAAPAVHALERI